MKKFLLSLAAVVMGLSSFAATTTITWADQTANMPSKWTQDNSFTVSGFKFDISKAEGGTNPTYNANGKDIRVYAKGTITVTSSTAMTEIAFVVSKQGLKRLGAVEASVGTMSGFENCTGKNEGDVTVRWTGSATAVTFTVDPQDLKVQYGTDKGTAAKPTAPQFDFVSTAITTGGAAVTKDEAELSFPQATYTVKFGESFPTPKLSKMTDAEPSYSSDNTEVATVNATTGEVKIVAVGTAVITAKTVETEDFYAGSASYTLVVEDANTFWAPECKDKTNPEFTFVKVSGDVDPWSVDDRYGLKASGYQNGTTNATDAVAASPVLDFSQRKAPITLDYRQAVNNFKVSGTNLAPDAAVAYLSVVGRLEGETEWTKLADVNGNGAAATDWKFYDGTQVDLSQYAGKKAQIGFRYTSTATCAGTWEIDNVVVKAAPVDGAVNVIVDEDVDAPVVYYNLQGVRVADPSNGLYIRVQGKKVTKVLVK